VIVSSTGVTDAAAEAKVLAGITGGDVKAYQADLSTPLATATDTVPLDIALTADLRTRLNQAITDGKLPGITIGKVQLLAVADGAGIDFLTDHGLDTGKLAIGGGTHGLALVTGLASGNQLYATSTDPATGNPQVTIVATSGDQAPNGPSVTSTMQMPGAVTKVLFDESAQMVEVLGEAQDGSGPTVYVVEPHGNAVFADHKLGFEPVALVMDHNTNYPSSSPGQILAFGATGMSAALDVGHYDFSWRLPGVILGALTLAALYLLTRVLFRRRTVAVLAGLFLLLDGMSFVQSRIAMNDVYTGFFILAAYLLFAWLWVAPRSRRAFWTVMPVIGVLLGLGLASKWVAAYAIGALGILVLARSALGRLVLLAGLIGITGVLGWMALAVPSGSSASGNLLFPMIMIVLTLGAVAYAVYRPIAWSDDEMRFAVGAPAALGILVVFGATALGRLGSGLAVGPIRLTPLPVGFALVVLGGLVYLAFNQAGRMGFGPMAVRLAGEPAVPPADPAPEGWLRLGDGLGLSTIWWAASLVVIPLVVYVISYLPWAAVEGHQIISGWPAGHTGQTLLDLTGQMYRYHNDLTAAHPASSPWWAWPLNLKPVWFYQGGFAGNTAGAIYDAGNMVVWWLCIPAMAFVAWQGFRRRSLGLALILVGFLAQWVSWARIDRAAFQYHYYTSVPFIVMGLAYLVAELWHGASRRTWLAARIVGALAVMGPALLWILRQPICWVAQAQLGWEQNHGSGLTPACSGNPGNLVVTASALALAIVGIAIVVVLVRQLVVLGRPKADGSTLAPRDMLPLVASALVGGVALAATRFLPSTDPLFSVPGFVPELIALAALVPLGLVAIQVLTARDARRFVLGLVAAVAIWFVILYPNISALPLPSDFVNAYQGLIPTYLYPFEFAVNTVDRSGSISFSDPRFFILMAFLVVASGVIAYSAWTWRQALASGEAPVSDPTDGGPSGEAGAA
jgi:predicted membrane-bound dolichyl-phosphate-mannose-protein mannosyltransferase